MIPRAAAARKSSSPLVCGTAGSYRVSCAWKDAGTETASSLQSRGYGSLHFDREGFEMNSEPRV
jgi:hypothetical protein